MIKAISPVIHQLTRPMVSRYFFPDLVWLLEKQRSPFYLSSTSC